jgi:iron complex outermembrane receptor protein
VNNTKISALKAGAAPLALGLAIFANPAFAQDAAVDCSTDPNAPECADQGGAPIIVTGSIFRRADVETASPVTNVTTENLDKRGISTIQEGLQRLSANNGPALTNSFSANGAFAGGASAVSLRGLSTNSTLVLFDGLRAAYYPLADDGTRNFVDLNTIPDDIVDHIEVLRDGASSSYGADAIAGVVNVITKKNVQGFHGRAEAGISERGDAAQYRLSGTYGMGDLEENGWNAYVSGFYYKSDQLLARQRPGVYGSDDLRSLCTDGVCGTNGVINGLQEDGFTGGFGQATPFVVRPRNATTGGAIPGVSSRYQLLNGCNGLPSYSPTAAELALPVNAASPTTVCQEDLTNLYGVINPDIERYGASARVTAKVGDDGEAYAEFNFLQTKVAYDGLPATIRANAPAPFYFPRYSTSANIAAYGGNTVLQLPVYICAARANCSTAADRQLNPNNPFAAQGYTAAILGRIPNLVEHDESRTRAYRGAIGFNGDITDNLNLSVKATAMHMDLQRKSTGYVYIQHLLDVIADGSFNFINPSQTSQTVLDYLAPENITVSTSDLVQAEAVLATTLTELPGGPLQFGVGGSIRYEAVDSPSANSDFNGPTERYFRLNGFASKGSRTVYSTFAEVVAPVLPQVELSASGRYDKYSTGPDNFSPKVGVKVKPIQQVVLRGTYSRGFRIPSFGESNATFPTTGYVSATKGIYTDTFLQQYGCTLATYTSCPTYVTGATYGQTSISNPNLQPEKSRSFTAGILVEPLRNVSFTVDYYNIKKTNAITTANNAPAIAAYYANQAIPAGYVIVPDAPDVNNPNAKPRIAFVQAPFINATTVKSEGIDFGASARFNLTDDIVWQTEAEASYIIELSTGFPDGSKERYDGTLGNYNLTAGSGTPKWRGTWLNSLTFADKYNLNVTMNYFGGYNFSAEDQTGPGTRGDCSLASGALGCDVPDYLTVDLGGSVKVEDRFTLYFNVQNLFDNLPPYDDVTYGAHLYNPIQGGEGILGRYFKVGAKVDF